jgi:hypothetical protein
VSQSSSCAAASVFSNTNVIVDAGAGDELGWLRQALWPRGPGDPEKGVSVLSEKTVGSFRGVYPVPRYGNGVEKVGRATIKRILRGFQDRGSSARRAWFACHASARDSVVRSSVAGGTLSPLSGARRRQPKVGLG